MNKKTAALFAALFLLGVTAVQSANTTARHLGVDLKGHSEHVQIERADEQSLAPVSMTRIGEDLFLFANYRNIYLFDAASRMAYPVRLDQKIPVWAPTAVYYSAYYDRLFIANYTGHDLIIAKIDRSEPRIRLLLYERLTDANIAGPEGIAIFNGGKYMAIANWEGGAVSLFERIDNRWQFQWKQTIAAAHGVAFAGEFLLRAGRIWQNLM